MSETLNDGRKFPQIPYANTDAWITNHNRDELLVVLAADVSAFLPGFPLLDRDPAVLPFHLIQI